MSRLSMLCGAAALSTLSLIPAAAFAQEGGPCTDDIAKLRRELSTQVGMGGARLRTRLWSAQGAERGFRPEVSWKHR